MFRSSFRAHFLASSLLAVPLLASCARAQVPAPLSAAPVAQSATGFVFNDLNRNRQRDANEPGIDNIRVSNGREITRTDAQGRYRLPVDDDTALFVIKPRGWATPLSADKLPQFYYLHKPKGSPSNFKYPGVAPTGPLPASVDFPLYPQNEPDKFRAVLFGDPQPRNEKEVDYIGHDVVEELIGTDAAFGVSLGDIAFDNLSIYSSLNQKIALIGIPWYNVIGNHDLNFEAPDDEHSDETFEATYGPSYYSFDYGPTHFIVLDDVTWIGGQKSEGKPRYIGGLGAEQLEFIKNDLAQIPVNQMVVLMMHIPLSDPGDYEKPTDGTEKRFIESERQELFRLIEKRPFCISISGHTHFQEHSFITREDGWQGAEPHHHIINVTVSGSWWGGTPDETGIPHTTMRDGAPNGYSFITFDGNKYSMEYKAARRPSDYQMNIYAPDEVESAQSSEAEVLVNVFAGSERSKVEMKLGENGAWMLMQRVARHDPEFARMKEIEERVGKGLPGRPLPNLINSPHLWSAKLPANAPVGTHLLQVRTTDMWGKTYQDRRLIQVK